MVAIFKLTRSWAYSIHANTIRYLLIVQTTSKSNDAAFARSIVEKVRAANVAINGGIVDDGIATLHVLKRIFSQEEIGMHVRIKSLDPLVPRLC